MDSKNLDLFERMTDVFERHGFEELGKATEWVLELYGRYEELEEENEKLTNLVEEQKEIIEDLERETFEGRGVF